MAEYCLFRDDVVRDPIIWLSAGLFFLEGKIPEVAGLGRPSDRARPSSLSERIADHTDYIESPSLTDRTKVCSFMTERDYCFKYMLRLKPSSLSLHNGRLRRKYSSPHHCGQAGH